MKTPVPYAKNHHYVPQFLLRQWADKEDKVTCWKWDGDKIAAFRPTTKSIMSEMHLYKARHVETPGIYEQTFSQLEGHAAAAIAKLRDRSRPKLEQIDYEAWACFVLAQRIRVPNKVAWAEKHARDGFISVFEEHDPAFDRLNLDERFKTPADYMEEYHPNVLANFHLHTIMQVINDPKNVNALLNMKWFVRRGHERPILLGDDPLVLVGDLHSDTCIIALPISGDEVFFAVSNEELKKKIVAEDHKSAASRINEDQSAQAQRFVVGQVAPRFLEKRLRKTPAPFAPSSLPSQTEDAA